MYESSYKRNCRDVKEPSSSCSAKKKAMDLLLYKNRTEKELYDKLTERGFNDDEAKEAIEYVKSFGYLNDENYAEYYVSSRGSKKGRASIKRELRDKGVDEELIESALEGLPCEDETILELLKKKAGAPHKLDEKEFRRLYGFFLRSGFSTGAIIKTLNNYQRQE